MGYIIKRRARNFWGALVLALFVVLYGVTPISAQSKISDGEIREISDAIFGREPKLGSFQIFRWSTDIKVAVVVDDDPERARLNAIRNYIFQVGLASGVGVKFVKPRQANYIVIVSQDILEAAVTDYYDYIKLLLLNGLVRPLVEKHKKNNSSCFNQIGVDTSFRIFGAITMIRADLSQQIFEQCVGSFTFSAISPLSGTRADFAKIYSAQGGRFFLTDFGKLVAEIYNDPKNRTGITKNQFEKYLRN